MKSNLYQTLGIMIIALFYSCAGKDNFIPTVMVEEVYRADGSFKKIHFTSSTIGFAAGSNGIFLITEDGGNSWKQLTTIDVSDQSFTALSFPTPLTGYVCSYEGMILKTTDGGKSWTEINTIYSPKSICFPSEQVGYLLSGNSVFKSIDGGETWDATGFNAYTGLSYLSSIYFFSEDSGYAASAYYQEWSKTYDGGNDWTNAGNGSPNSNSLKYIKVNSSLFYFASYGIYFTEGLDEPSYSLEGNGFLYDNDDFIITLALSENNTMVAAGGGVFAVSYNGGDDWTEMYSQTGFSFEIQDIASSTDKLFYGINDSLLCSISLK